ncbi:MAG: response regulator transcription factor [Dehalococcoidales bacterium]|nr:response regulator transcription factor [Dehalococcoidales bacterium]
MEQIRILLADDHPTVRAGTKRILEEHHDLSVVSDASDGESALELAKSLKPDVIILDIRMPKLNGFDVIKQLKHFSPNTRVLVFTAYDNDIYVLTWMEAGASGYLLKTCLPEELVDAVRSVHRGHTVLTPDLVMKVGRIWMDTRQKITHPLTARQSKILELASKGLRNKEIAEQLNISIRTVEGHFNNILTKLKVNSRIEAAMHALSQKMIDSGDSID